MQLGRLLRWLDPPDHETAKKELSGLFMHNAPQAVYRTFSFWLEPADPAFSVGTGRSWKFDQWTFKYVTLWLDVLLETVDYKSMQTLAERTCMHAPVDVAGQILEAEVNVRMCFVGAALCGSLLIPVGIRLSVRWWQTGRS